MRRYKMPYDKGMMKPNKDRLMPKESYEKKYDCNNVAGLKYKGNMSNPEELKMNEEKLAAYAKKHRNKQY